MVASAVNESSSPKDTAPACATPAARAKKRPASSPASPVCLIGSVGKCPVAIFSECFSQRAKVVPT
jgi:hypothetical protein